VSQVAASGSGLLDAYRGVLGDGPIRTLVSLARELAGHRLVMVNSTATGGGVAEILHRMVPLLIELGIPTTWEVMPGDARFHAITKKLHNRLHGMPVPITPEDREYYDEFGRRAAGSLALDGDLILIHDPQPAAMVVHRRRPRQQWVWRCHIDLSRAGADAWALLAPSVSAYDAAVFSHVEFVPALELPTYVVPPSIDPFSDKNRELAPEELDAALQPLDLPVRRPWVTQVSRFDRLKDPLGVLQAFTLLRRRVEAHLVLAGGSADDDPEGETVLAEVREHAAKRSDVSILALPSDAHVAINAIQRRSTVVVQKSLREGFALTVAEALWKRRAVVGSAVGGIPLQIVHEHTGLLSRSIEGCAHQVERALRSPGLRRRLGEAGRERVRHHFLHPREARDYLAVFATLVRSASRAA
jgi:trehalose synthase